MGCMCAECKYAKLEEDNNKKMFQICLHRESKNFLHELDIAFDSCDYGIVDDYCEKGVVK